MRELSNRMDACLNDSKSQNDNGKSRQSVANRIFIRAKLIWIIAIGIALFLSAGPAFGQFTVQPMKMELQVTPGKLVRTTLSVHSFDPDATHTIYMRTTDLSQLDNGEWAIIEPNDLTDPNSPHYGFDISELSSCKDWISFSPSTFQLDPQQEVPVEVIVRVDRGVRGFYGAGILATTSPMLGVGDVSVVVRFYVPVIIEIQDRPARANVQATDVGLELIGGTDSTTGREWSRTLATMNVENNGGSYSRIKPLVRIWSFSEGHWRIITTTEFEEKSIIPGVKFKVNAPIRKSLPKGKYKIAGYLYVDGRRRKKVEKEIDYVGEKVTGVASDAPLDLDPIDVTMDGIPGGVRATTLKVYNASKETVNVRTAMGLQNILAHNTQGDVKGEDLDCTQWITVTPEQFTLRPDGGSVNLRIAAEMPELTAAYPSYFTLLALWASYPDGQDAGVTTTNICLRNSKIEAAPAAAAIRLVPQTLGDSKYLVVAEFGNVGPVQFDPIRVKAGLAMPNGIHRVSTFLYGDPDLMLPFERRTFQGVLDLSVIEADMYTLAAAIEYAPKQWEPIQMAVQVSIEGVERILKITGVEAELRNPVEVKW